MDAIIHLLVSYGDWGLLVAAFLAGSIIPFPSEAVLLAFLALGLDPVWLVVFATIGNTLGGLAN